MCITGLSDLLSRAPFDLSDMEMEQSQLSALLRVGGAAQQGSNFWQKKDLLHQNPKVALAHASYLRGHAFHLCPTGNQAVVPFLPVSIYIIVDAVLQPLDFVPVLLYLGDVLGILLFQFLA